MRTNVKEVKESENSYVNRACFVYRGTFSNRKCFTDSDWAADGTWERKIISTTIDNNSSITQISMFPLNRAKPTTENPWYDIAGIALFYDEYSAQNYDFSVKNPETVTVTWMNGETEVRKDTLLKGMSLTKVVPPTVTAEGKTFKHWYTTDKNTAVESFEGITEDTVFNAAYEEDLADVVTEPIYVRNAATGSPYVSLEGSMTIGYTALDAENNIPYYHLNLAKGNVPQLNNYSMNKSIDTTKDKMYLVVYLRSETSGKTAILYDWSSGKSECSGQTAFCSGASSMEASKGDGNWERVIFEINTNNAPKFTHQPVYLFGASTKAEADTYIDVAGFAYFYDLYSAQNYSFAVENPETITLTWKSGDEIIRTDKLLKTQTKYAPSGFEPEGKKVAGWTKDDNNTNQFYSPSLDIANLSADTTLYAYLVDSAANENLPTGDNVFYVNNASGKDDNDGLTAATALKTFSKAYGKIETEGTIILVGSIEGVATLGQAGKKITYVGYNDAATIWLYHNGGSIQFAGDVAFENIAVVKTSGTEPYISVKGFNLTIGENYRTYVRTGCGNIRIAQFHYNGSFPATIDSTVTLKSGSYEKVLTSVNTVGLYQVVKGRSEIVIDGATVDTVATAHNYQPSSWFKGTQQVTVNSGTVSGTLSFDAAYGQTGLRYIQINGGKIDGTVRTTDTIFGATNSGVNASSVDNFTAVSVVEVNGGNFKTKTIGVGGAMDKMTRVVIFNNGMGEGFKVNDTKATVLKAGPGGKVKAVVTEPTAENGWESTLTGFAITPDNADGRIYIDGVEVEKKDIYTFEAGTTHTILFADKKICNVTWSILGVDTVDQIPEGTTLTKTVDEKVVDKEHYYDFDGWYIGDEKIDLAAYALTDDVTITGKYTVKGDIATSVVKNFAKLDQVDYSETDMTKNPRTFTAAAGKTTNFKGVDAVEIVPYYNAADYEGRSNTAIRTINIEGGGWIPSNFSTYPRNGKAVDGFSADVYDHIVVKYYYVPGTNTDARQVLLWFQRNDSRGESVARLDSESATLTSGKWTYAHFDLSDQHGKGDSGQYHLRPMNGVKVTDLVATGEKIYFDTMTYLTTVPTIATIKFVGEDDALLYEVDALNGETVGYYGDTDMTKDGYALLGWNTDKNATTALETLSFTEAKTLYPIYKKEEPKTIVTDDTTVPEEVTITIEQKTEAPSEDKLSAIETALGSALDVNETPLVFEVTAEKAGAAVTDLGKDVTFKIYFAAIENYSDAKTYRLFHFNADGTLKEECALTKNADHFAFTVSTLSPFVLAEVTEASDMVEYSTKATYFKKDKDIVIDISVKGGKIGYGSFGFKYDTEAFGDTFWLSFNRDRAAEVTEIPDVITTSPAGTVRCTYMGWNGTTVAPIDAETNEVWIATVRFVVSDSFDEADFRANPTKYFYVDTPDASENLSEKVYKDGYWRVDKWSDTLTEPIGEDPVKVNDLTVAPSLYYNVTGKFEKLGNSVVSIAPEGSATTYNSKAVVTLYKYGETTPYIVATTDEAEKSGNTVSFTFEDVEAGNYYFTIEKNGYIKYTSGKIVVTEETDITNGVAVVLIAGDIKGSFADTCGDGVVDIDDFIRVIRGFDPNAGELLKGAVDINENGNVDIEDLAAIKTNFKKTSANYNS